MSNLAQQLTQLTLNKQAIAAKQVPLNELCMLEWEGKSYGPLWSQDLQELKSELALYLNEMRWRRFGTEQWSPLTELLGDADELMIEQEQLQEDQAMEEELFSSVHQDNVLPPPPSREQFAWGREAVAKALEQFQLQSSDMESDAMASLLSGLRKTPIATSKTTTEESKKEEEIQVPVADAVRNMRPTATFYKIAASAVAGVALIVGLRMGIARLPNSLLSFPTGNNASVAEQSDNDSPTVNGPIKLPESNNRRGRTPASSAAMARKEQASRRAQERRRPNNNFRDSQAYQERDIPPEGAGFNDVERTVEADFQMDDGSAPAEQDPLRRKLGRDTVNPDPEEDRAPASEDQPMPDVPMDEPPPSEE